eukprot:gene18007-24416_t
MLWHVNYPHIIRIQQAALKYVSLGRTVKPTETAVSSVRDGRMQAARKDAAQEQTRSPHSASKTKTRAPPPAKTTVEPQLSDDESELSDVKPQLSEDDTKVAKILALKAEWPDNIAVQCFDKTYYDSLKNMYKSDFLNLFNSSLEYPDSVMGCYVGFKPDYNTYSGFLKPVLERYHKVDLSVKGRTSNWVLSGVEGVPEDGILDLAKLGLPEMSMCVRVCRNFFSYSAGTYDDMPGRMSKQQRIDMEQDMGKVFETLIADEKCGGKYVSLTPGHPNFIDDGRYEELVNTNIMFKDSTADPYLKSTGISADWPHGRGCYISADKELIIWLGEEDHLRFICKQKRTMLNAVFDRVKSAMDPVEGLIGVKFSEMNCRGFGYVTSCPTNVGAGMRASVQLSLPNLTADGTDAKARDIAKPLGLSVRGLDSEHTSIGADGTVEISNSACLGITEAEIITSLYAERPDNIAVQRFDKSYHDSLGGVGLRWAL